MSFQEPTLNRARNQEMRAEGRGFSIRGLSIGPLTIVLMGICVAVAALTKLGVNEQADAWFFISNVDADNKALPDVMSGQIWRLWSPIFLHFGLMHIVFNMVWLKDLGTAIERRCSTRVLLFLVLVIGLVSNLAQFYLGTPFFGGMSGVVYGLFGFVWMKSVFDPQAGMHITTQTVLIMIGWLLLCFTGKLGPVANFAHLGGLLAGVVWGFVAAKMTSSRRRGRI